MLEILQLLTFEFSVCTPGLQVPHTLQGQCGPWVESEGPGTGTWRHVVTVTADTVLPGLSLLLLPKH